MGITKLWPTRSQNTKEPQVVADLDKIVAEPVPFKWNGKIHYIKALTTVEFLKCSEAFARMAALADQKEHHLEELIDVYTKLFSSVCDTIGRKEVMQMSQPQVGALYQLIIDTVRGRVKEEKKNLIESQNPTSK